MTVLKTLFLPLTLILTMTDFAQAENRKGLVVGLGGGLHSISIDFNESGANFGSQSKNGLATSFKLGGGITDQFALYYVRNASWYDAAFFDGVSISDTTYTIGITGVGATYFLAPTAPSGYFLVAFGIGDISAPFERHIRPDTGSAYMLGGGYEMSKHFLIEATLLNANIDSSGDSSLTIESSSWQVTLNYLFY